MPRRCVSCGARDGMSHFEDETFAIAYAGTTVHVKVLSGWRCGADSGRDGRSECGRNPAHQRSPNASERNDGSTRRERFAERTSAAAFVLSFLGFIGLAIVYWRGGQPQALRWGTSRSAR